jgi:nucleoside-diphosphate-sugar epimerase
MERILVLGYGPVGSAVVAQGGGRRLRVAQRSSPEGLPAGVEFTACDVLDEAAVRTAAEGVSQIVLSVGFAYDRKVWRADWPRAMANVLSATEAVGARMVFVDNLYLYGPQTAPLNEGMPLTRYGAKPALRAELAETWMAAHRAGRVRVAAVRASDFYGPGVTQSHLGALSLGALAEGRPAMLIVDPDQPHDFAYVPDIARAVWSLLDAPDAEFGRAWHVPQAPIRTTRELLALGAIEADVALKIRRVPMSLLPMLGVFNPLLREMAEMRFQWDRPYCVDATRFARRFWSDATPFEVGVPLTIGSFQPTNGVERSVD